MRSLHFWCYVITMYGLMEGETLFRKTEVRAPWMVLSISSEWKKTPNSATFKTQSTVRLLAGKCDSSVNKQENGKGYESRRGQQLEMCWSEKPWTDEHRLFIVLQWSWMRSLL